MKISGGILPFKVENGEIKVFLGHMGGPFWKNKKRSWSIFKGEVEKGEDLLDAAKREFKEETSKEIEGEFIPLGSVERSGKRVYVWAVNRDLDTNISSNLIKIKWPPKSNKTVEFPEMDMAKWFNLKEAKEILSLYLLPFLDRLERLVKEGSF